MTQSPDTDKKHAAEVVSLDTRSLLVRHVKGDSNAFGELIEKFRRRVYSYLVRCAIPEASRDDLFQEIFIKVHHAAPTYQPDRPLEPWLFTVVANTVRSYYRKQAVQSRLAEAAGRNSLTQQTTTTSEEIAEARETAQWLEQQISLLPQNQREVVALCCFNTLSQKEVSTILNFPVNTVKTHLHRARATLAKALAKRNKLVSGEVC